MGQDMAEHSGHRARLRKRLLDGGGAALLDHELLEYLLALALPRRDTKPLAKRLITRFGSYAAVVSAPPEELAGAGELTERSEEHTSELQSLMRTSYAVFCLQTTQPLLKSTVQYTKNK